MIRFISKKSLEIENLKFHIECLERNLDTIERLERKFDAKAAYDELNTRFLTALEWNEKFKCTIKNLREEKLELEMENEFLRKKIKSQN